MGLGRSVATIVDMGREAVLDWLDSALSENTKRTQTAVVEVKHREREEASVILADLEQNHLPALEDAGIIRYDADRGVVTKGPNFSDAESLLELETEDPTHSPRIRRL